MNPTTIIRNFLISDFDQEHLEALLADAEGGAVPYASGRHCLVGHTGDVRIAVDPDPGAALGLGEGPDRNQVFER